MIKIESGYYYYTDYLMGENEYYNSIKTLSGKDLEVELRKIVNNNFNPVSYGDARYAY